MDKPVYPGLSISEISRTLIYEFWYDYIKPKYQNNARLCYMDKVLSLILKLKISVKILENDVEKIFGTLNYDISTTLPTWKNKKVIGLMKDELGGNIMTEFVTLRAEG